MHLVVAKSPIVTSMSAEPGWACSCSTIAADSSMPSTRMPRQCRAGRGDQCRCQARGHAHRQPGQRGSSPRARRLADRRGVATGPRSAARPSHRSSSRARRQLGRVGGTRSRVSGDTGPGAVVCAPAVSSGPCIVDSEERSCETSALGCGEEGAWSSGWLKQTVWGSARSRSATPPTLRSSSSWVSAGRCSGGTLASARCSPTAGGSSSATTTATPADRSRTRLATRL